MRKTFGSFHRAACLSLLGFFLPSVSGWAAQTLQLSELLDQVLSRDPILLKAEAQVWIQEAQAQNAWAQMLPSLDAFWKSGYERRAGFGAEGSAQPQSATTSSLGLSLTENLYDNGERYRNYQAAQFEAQKARQQAISRREKLLGEIFLAYLDYSRAAIQAELNEKQLARILKQFEGVEKKYLGGMRTRVDLLRIQSQKLRAEYSVNQIKVESNQKKQVLAQWLSPDWVREKFGSASDVESLIRTGDLQWEPIRLEKDPKWLEVLKRPEPEAVLSPPDLIAQKLQIDVQHQNEINQKRRWFPEIFIQLDGGVRTDFSSAWSASFLDRARLEGNASLTLKWNLFDFGTRARSVVIAQKQTDQARWDYEVSKREWVQELSSFRLRSERLRKDLRIFEEVEKVEAESFQTLERQYYQGEVSYLDYAAALDTLLSAQSELLVHRIRILQNLVENLSRAGTLMEWVRQQGILKSSMKGTERSDD